jgi:uncharacterized protein (UPF0248 family)
MTGYRGRTAYAIPLDRLVEIVERYQGRGVFRRVP